MRKIIFFVFLLCFFSAESTFAIKPSFNWNFRTNEKGEWSILESYSANIVNDITDLIKFSGTMRYTRNRSKRTDVKTLAPSATLDLTNDLFNWSLSGYLNKSINDKGPDSTSITFDTNFSSHWRKIPNFLITYMRNKSYDNQSPHKLNSETRSVTFNTSYKIHIISLNYNYGKTKSFNYVSDSTSKNFSHYISGSLRKNFWGRLNFSITHGFLYSKSMSRAKAGEGGYAEINIPISSITGGVDDTPDEGKLTESLPLKLEENLNLSLMMNYLTLNKVLLYLDKELTRDLEWDIYTSDDGETWIYDSSISSYYSYDPISDNHIHTMELSKDFRERYVKFVLKTEPDEDVQITKVEAYYTAYTPAKSIKMTSESQSQRTNISTSLKIRKNMNLMLTYSRTLSQPDPGPSSIQKNLASRFSWRYSQLFSPSLSFTQTSSKTRGSEKTSSRNFSFTNSSVFLKNIFTSTTFTLRRSYKEDRRTSQLSTISTKISSKILPDLSGSSTITGSRTKNYISDVKTKSFSGEIKLTSRLSPRLTLESTYRYSKSRTEGENISVSRRRSLELSGTWRLSDILLIRSVRSWSWSDGDKSWNGYYSLWLATSSNTQTNLRYSESSDGTKTLFLFFSWVVSNKLSFTGSYTKTEKEGKTTERYNIHLTLKF